MKRRSTSALLAVLAVMLVVALTGCVASAAGVASPGLERTVTASGSGTVHATPDQADMTFGVTAQNQNAKKALESASKSVDRITSAMSKAGIAKEDVQTQNVNVDPVYDYKSSKPVITGYRADITVRVRVRDIGTLGDVIGAANAAGADNIQGPAFTIADDSVFHAQAIDKAVADARKRAETMAKAAGKSVGAVVSISEVSVSSPSPYYGARDLKAAGAEGISVPVSLGQLDIVASVEVVYELK